MPKLRRIFKRYSILRPPDLRCRERTGPWWNWYDGYLRSDIWAEVRRRVLAKARGECQDCRAEPAVTVHHLTYDRVGHECWGDLQALCLECHAEAHKR